MEDKAERIKEIEAAMLEPEAKAELRADVPAEPKPEESTPPTKGP